MHDQADKLRVLVINDDVPTRGLVISCFKPENLKVDEAADGKEALGMLQKHRYDLVVSEWDLPGVTGEQLLKWMRSRPEIASTPFVMLTHSHDKARIIRAVKEGVSGFVIKPFTADTLIKKLSEIDHRFAQQVVCRTDPASSKTSSDKHQLLENAEDLVQSIGIPSQPMAIIELTKEMGLPQSDIKKVAKLLSGDLSLSAKAIKIAASPFFGSIKVTSIEQALLVLGLQNFQILILSASLKESFDVYAGNMRGLMERFWNHCVTIADASAYIARRLRPSIAELAYMAGLFHDCAIPILMKKYRAYSELFDHASGTVSLQSLLGEIKSIIGVESELFGTNHCVAGYLMARSWHLPNSVSTAINYHHYINVDIHKDVTAKELAAILILSEYITQNYDSSIVSSSGDTLDDWISYHGKVLCALDLQPEEVRDLRDDVIELIADRDSL